MKSTMVFWFAIGLTVLAGCDDPKLKQALDEIRELETKRVEYESMYEQLNKFQVVHSQFIMSEQEFGRKQPIIVLAVRNGTDRAVSRAYFEGTIASPGRSDPWYKDRFNHRISGRLEPGEEATWHLEPNMFSGWGKVDAPADAALTVAVENIDGADNKSIYSIREFTERDRKRLDELKKQHSVEYTQAVNSLRHDDRKAPLSGSGQKGKDNKTDALNKTPDMMPALPGPEKKIESAPQIAAVAANGAHEAPAPTPAAEKPAQKPSLSQPSSKNKTPPPVPAGAQPATPAAAQPAPTASKSIIYTLQLGSFQRKDAASSFSRSLSARGYKPDIVKVTVPDKGITYRVYLGTYKNIQEARKMAAALVKKEGISAIVISR